LKISRNDRVKNEVVLPVGKEGRSILHTIQLRKVNGIGDNVRRNCLLKHVIQGETSDVLLRYHKVGNRKMLEQNGGNFNENLRLMK
jgi:hypothetical protein